MNGLIQRNYTHPQSTENAVHEVRFYLRKELSARGTAVSMGGETCTGKNDGGKMELVLGHQPQWICESGGWRGSMRGVALTTAIHRAF